MDHREKVLFDVKHTAECVYLIYTKYGDFVIFEDYEDAKVLGEKERYEPIRCRFVSEILKKGGNHD